MKSRYKGEQLPLHLKVTVSSMTLYLASLGAVQG